MACREATALGLDDEAFVINSFSKYFCMTGWRVGWIIVPPSMIDRIDRLQQNAFICAPEISQIAALAAFEGRAEMEAVRKGYEINRAMFLKRLPELGFRTIQPIDGAFYAYADASALTNDTTAFRIRPAGRGEGCDHAGPRLRHAPWQPMGAAVVLWRPRHAVARI